MSEHYAVSDGIGRTIRLHAGPTSKDRAVETAAGLETGYVVDEGTLDMLTLASEYEIEDVREASE